MFGRHPSATRSVRIIPAVSVVCFALVAQISPMQAAEETLELSVIVNDYAIDKIGEFTLRKDILLARPSELKDLGLRLPTTAVAGPDGLVSLSTIPGLGWRFDQSTQTLYLTTGVELLLPDILEIAPPLSEMSRIESGLGVTLNYDLMGSSVDGVLVGSGMFDLRGFSPWGVVSSTMLAYAGDSPTGGGPVVRLDSSYVYSDARALRRYSLGDLISGGLNWTRPVRLGGIQIQSDFSLRPDLVTLPLPTVSGEAAVPSTIDVLVNNTRLLSQQIAPGPFEIMQLPIVNGMNSVTTTVTDALGHQVTRTLPFYGSADLLAPGLQSYSAEFGRIRENWGIESNDYDDYAGSATYRRGLSSFITAEAHVEGMANMFVGGAGVAINIFNFGVVDLAAGGSSTSGHDGGLLALTVQRTGQRFSFGISAILASKNYYDIAAIGGDPMPQRQFGANVGLSLGAFGSFGLAYTGIDRADAEVPVDLVGVGRLFVMGFAKSDWRYGDSNKIIEFLPAQHAHVLSASYSLQVGHISVYATGFRDFADRGDSGVMLGITIPTGARSAVSANIGTGTDDNTAQVEAVQSAVRTGDWGYQVYADGASPIHAFGEVQYKASWGLVSAGADHVEKQTTLRGEVQGALSVADGGVFVSNTIDDSFAVVDTNGVAGVRVLDENREVGRTDSNGRILVPNLRSFEPNRLAIDPADVPVSDTVSYTTREVRPQDRSGVVVRFPIHRSYAALVQLVDQTGHPIPVGSTATLVATGVAVPVGYDGKVYIENLGPKSNRLDVTVLDGHHCTATFDYRFQPDVFQTIGPLQCGTDQ